MCSSTGCLKIDATHLYEHDSLLRQAQRRSFITRLIKNASFGLETSNQCCLFNCYYISFQKSFFFFLVSCLSNKSCSYKWVASLLKQFWMILSPNSDAKYYFLSCPNHSDQGLIIIMAYYFRICNKKTTTL